MWKQQCLEQCLASLPDLQVLGSMGLRNSDWLFAKSPFWYSQVPSQDPGMFAVMEIEFIASVLKLVVTLLRCGCATVHLCQGFFNILEKSRN